MILIPNDLSRSSRLVSEFVRKPDRVKRFLPNNFIPDIELFEKILSAKRKRAEIASTVAQTMNKFNMTETQIANLRLLEDERTLCVVTGQQVGLFGGPLYTFSKIYTAIAESKQLAEKYPEYNFVPLFWVADNDHDAEEAGKTNIFDRNYTTIELKTDYEQRPIPVAQRLFGQDIESLIETVADSIYQSRYSDELIDLLRSIYRNGQSWSECFVEFLNLFFNELGLLFISAEQIRKNEHFASITWKELNNKGISKTIIEKVNSELKARKHHIQAMASDINLFYHKNDERITINPDEIDLYRELFKQNAKLFSPKVLMRPVMQDYFLPTALYVAGPGELAYWMQTVDLYTHYAVTMPKVAIRKSFYFLDNRTIRFLEKYEIQAEIFFLHQDEFMQKIPAFLLDEDTESSFLKSELKLKEIYDELSDLAVKIDQNLSKSLAVAYMKSLEQIEHIRKRAISAQKKNREEFTDRFMQTRNLLMPSGKHQERFYSVINLLANEGILGTKNLFNAFFR